MSSTRLEALDPGQRILLVGGVLDLLQRSRLFEPRRMWPHAVVIWRDGEKRVAAHGDFIGWARANDLRTVADECAGTRVPPGHVMVWLEVDRESVAIARFLVIDMARELRGLREHVQPALRTKARRGCSTR